MTKRLMCFFFLLSTFSLLGTANAQNQVDLWNITAITGHGTRIDYTGNGGICCDDRDWIVHNIFNTVYGDVNLDGIVNAVDMAILVQNLGTYGLWQHGDVDGDLTISGFDLAILLDNWLMGTGNQSPDAGSCVCSILPDPPGGGDQ